MAKFTLLLATFALFFLVANATIYRTTVVINDEESRSGQQQRCQRQFQEQQQLQQCRSFLSQRIQGYNPRQQQDIQQCCQQLEQLDRECRCPGLEQVTMSQVRQGQLGDHQKRQIIETAQRIPSMCGMRSMQCDFETLTMDNSPRNDQQRCQQQFQEQQQLRQCKSYLSRRIQEQQPYGSNPRQEQEIQQCCRQLKQLDTECRCPGLKRMTRSQVSQSQLGDQQKKRIIQIAESIPSMCNIRPMECDLESSRSDM
ncbi:hypothetical protein Ddye_027323 [Dipteronia dyeriana]|uniref:Bifunctional inhibitor/plant lipid transfer protein/seed storage helical domain-containing protein n=1 Tax=Dipteronia dyeriana TaxID=168575 RepID=A0AAD9WRA0_9ROSI|nr:hypothetical protein Ddye_027323 [Dipteronia dyeriana]